MSYRMAHVTNRTESSRRQFRLRVPQAVLDRLRGQSIPIAFPADREASEPFFVRATIGREVKFSLKTRDAGVASERAAIAKAQLLRAFGAAESGATRLSHKQLVALSKAVYDLYVERHSDDPGSPAFWAANKGLNRAAMEGRINIPPLRPGEADGEQLARELFGQNLTAGINALPRSDPAAGLESRFGELATWVLTEQGLTVDDETRGRLLLKVGAALQKAFWQLKRNAAGDYFPDPAAQSFGTFVPPQKAGPNVGKSLTALVEAWWTEAQATGRKPSTYESYSSAMAKFVDFLGHEDVSRVSREDVIRFKNFRLGSINPRNGKRIAAKTVKDSDLAALKSIFGWAKDNDWRVDNPAEGVTLDRSTRPILRDPGFTDEEAVAILRAARDYRRKARESSKTAAAKRWVPWLCAYSGARVGEMAQLRKQDVRREGERWIVTITPDAGTVKTNKVREIPLHPHLVEMGFPAFVQLAPVGHLFLTPPGDGDVRGSLQGVKNRLQAFVRKIVKDPNVAPNHGWRHRFKTVGREAGISETTLAVIAGQRPPTVGERYGATTTRTMAAAIERLPWYDVNQAGDSPSEERPRKSGRRRQRAAAPGPASQSISAFCSNPCRVSAATRRAT
jgi:integrase